jgi:hypothetical protein
MQLVTLIIGSVFLLSPLTEPVEIMIQKADIVSEGIIFSCDNYQCVKLTDPIRGTGSQVLKLCQESEFDSSYKDKRYIFLLKKGESCSIVIGNERGVFQEIQNQYNVTDLGMMPKSELIKLTQKNDFLRKPVIKYDLMRLLHSFILVALGTLVLFISTRKKNTVFGFFILFALSFVDAFTFGVNGAFIPLWLLQMVGLLFLVGCCALLIGKFIHKTRHKNTLVRIASWILITILVFGFSLLNDLYLRQL